MVVINGKYVCMALCFWLVTLESCQSIMVEFGTSKGPILPRESKDERSSYQPKTIVPRSPAPVHEQHEDTPNPPQYQVPFPHQYRAKLYSYKPNPNLILGTPLDIKYTPSLEKYNLLKKAYAKSLRLDYTGPHLFDKQDYEFYQIKKYVDQKKFKSLDQKVVPQIGVVYSSGVRYYVPQVPQVVYYTPQVDVEENEVYDRNDDKYYGYRH